MDDKLNRREFLKQTAKAAALATAFGGAYAWLDGRPDFPAAQTAKAVKADYSLPIPGLANKLAVATGESPAELTRRAVASLGGIERFIARGDKVVIKPNCGWERTPEQGADTNPEIIGELSRLCLAAGAARVVVTDFPCHDPRRSFARSGIQEAAEKAGAAVVIPAEGDYREVDLKGKLLTEWPVLKPFLEATKVINVPIVKHHILTRATIGMKNLYGILGGERSRLHQQVDRSIVDLALFLRPTLVVVDAYRVLLRNGPTGGSLADVKMTKTVYATVDQVAADAFGCQFLGLQPHQVGHIALANQERLGSMDLSHFEIIQG